MIAAISLRAIKYKSLDNKLFLNYIMLLFINHNIFLIDHLADLSSLLNYVLITPLFNDHVELLYIFTL